MSCIMRKMLNYQRNRKDGKIMGNLNLVTGYRGAAHVTAADDGSLNVAVWGSGQYVLNRGNKFAALVVSNNTIRISDGDIMLQGRHIRLNEGGTVDLTIENGAQGKSRNDLIVCRYTRNTSTGVEDCSLVVIKGTPADSTPVDPAYTSGDIINDHDTTVDMPLYRVPIVGLNVQTLVPLFSIATLTATDPDALHRSGGTMAGALTTKGIILTPGVDFFDSLPGSVTPNKLIFVKV